MLVFFFFFFNKRQFLQVYKARELSNLPEVSSHFSFCFLDLENSYLAVEVDGVIIGSSGKHSFAGLGSGFSSEIGWICLTPIPCPQIIRADFLPQQTVAKPPLVLQLRKKRTLQSGSCPPFFLHSSIFPCNLKFVAPELAHVQYFSDSIFRLCMSFSLSNMFFPAHMKPEKITTSFE